MLAWRISRSPYGCRFYNWLWSKAPEPYGSYGNGSAMRVSAAGWLYDTLEETRRIARMTAEVTHNHPEGMMKMNTRSKQIAVVMTNRNPGVDQTESGIERLVDSKLNE